MISQPRPINRVFSRRLILLSSHLVPFRRPQAQSEIRVRDFLTLGHFMAYGEPTNYELSLSNLIDEPWEVYGPANH